MSHKTKKSNLLDERARIERYTSQMTEGAKHSALARYVPQKKEPAIHQALKDGKKIVVVAGANGMGKTTALVTEALSYCLGYRPWDRSKTITPPARVGLFVEDFTHSAGEDLFPVIDKFLDPDWIDRTDRLPGTRHPHKWWWKNGSILKMLSYYQPPKTYEGVAWDFGGFNEPPPRHVWIPTIRGIAKKDGVALFALTAVDDKSAWIFEELYSVAGIDPEIAQITGTKNDSFYPPEALGRFEKSLDESEKEARIYGRFFHLTGRIYKEFDEAFHVISEERRAEIHEMVASPTVPKGMVIDPHDQRPFAMVWFLITPKDEMIFFEEWPTDRFEDWKNCTYSNADYASYIRDLEEKMNMRPVVWRLIDPNAGQRRQMTSGESVVEQLARMGLPFDYRIHDAVTDGHLAVKERLSFDKEKPLDASNHPRLLITSNCDNCIRAMRNYVWKRDRRDDGTTLREKPSKRGKDFADCIRYAVVGARGYVNPQSLLAGLRPRHPERYMGILSGGTTRRRRYPGIA